MEVDRHINLSRFERIENLQYYERKISLATLEYP